MKQITKKMGKCQVVAGLVLVAGIVRAAGFTPFADSFDEDPTASGKYVVQHQPVVSLQHKASMGTLIGKGESDSGNFSMTAEIPNLPGNGFKATLNVLKYTSSQNQIRLCVLTRKGAVAVSGYAGYLKTAKDGVCIMKDGKQVAGEEWAGKAMGSYDMTLTGTYNSAGALELELTVTDGSNTQTVKYVDPEPAQYDGFGISGRVMKGRIIEFDQLAIEAL